MLPYFGILIPIMALGIPILAITLGFREKTEKNRIRELELRKEILQLENENQNGKLRLLEEENRKYDRILAREDSAIKP